MACDLLCNKRASGIRKITFSKSETLLQSGEQAPWCGTALEVKDLEGSTVPVLLPWISRLQHCHHQQLVARFTTGDTSWRSPRGSHSTAPPRCRSMSPTTSHGPVFQALWIKLMLQLRRSPINRSPLACDDVCEAMRFCMGVGVRSCSLQYFTFLMWLLPRLAFTIPMNFNTSLRGATVNVCILEVRAGVASHGLLTLRLAKPCSNSFWGRSRYVIGEALKSCRQLVSPEFPLKCSALTQILLTAKQPTLRALSTWIQCLQ